MMENAALRSAGLKVTSPRVKILHVLEQSKDRHLSAEDVYRVLMNAGEDVGLATIYRVLTQFEEAGLVHRHNFEGDSAVFELDDGQHHDHLVCVRCGKVEEFLDEEIEVRQHDIAVKNGYRIKGHSLTIYGECPPCVLGQQTPSSSS